MPTANKTTTVMSRAPANTRAVVPTLANATIGSAWRSASIPVAAMLPATDVTEVVLCISAPANTPSSAHQGRLFVDRRINARRVRDVLS